MKEVVLNSLTNKLNVSSLEEINFICLDVKNNEKLDLVLEKNSNVLFSILAKDEIGDLEITADVKEGASLDIYFADFSKNEAKAKISLNLTGENAKINWHLASLSAGNDKKEFSVCVSHRAIRTTCTSDNYGVCKNEGKLIFSGTSHILNGCKKSETKQNAKIMVFDALSNGVAKPILKIDENDIQASHAAIVGKVNDEHMFYLTSRGLSEAQAKELITFGYLKPIVKGFTSEDIQNEIIKLIEGRM